MDLVQRVLAAIRRFDMLPRGADAGVAVSGGADSVCLLHVLRELAATLDVRLTVLHLNHRLRGAESDADQDFVAAMAARLELPSIIRTCDIPAAAGNLEQAARRARLEFFREAISSGAVERVATGHTRGDQAETVLFRLLRGSGSAGLAGIRPATGSGLVRPLIDVYRADVQAYLRESGIPWREDSTNAGSRFARNRLRHDLLPLLAREWNPEISETLANTAEWARAEEEYWEGELDRLQPEYLEVRTGAVLVRAGRLARLPRAAARRMVRRAMQLAKGDLRGIDFAHSEAVVRLAVQPRGHGRVQAAGLDIRRSFDWIRIAPCLPDPRSSSDYEIAAAVPGTLQIPPAALRISLELIENSEGFEKLHCVYNGEMGCLDWSRLRGSLVIRNWRAGDRYRPTGSAGEEKIKTLFQKSRIPLWERHGWPVLTDDKAIVWVRRFGPAAEFAADSGSAAVLLVRLRSEKGIALAQDGVY